MIDITLHEVEAFVQTRMWKQICEDALTRALLLSEDNDILDPIGEPSKISRNQGEIKALKWVVDLPKVIKEEIEEKRGEKENGK